MIYDGLGMMIYFFSWRFTYWVYLMLLILDFIVIVVVIIVMNYFFCCLMLYSRYLLIYVLFKCFLLAIYKFNSIDWLISVSAYYQINILLLLLLLWYMLLKLWLLEEVLLLFCFILTLSLIIII